MAPDSFSSLTIAIVEEPFSTSSFIFLPLPMPIPKKSHPIYISTARHTANTAITPIIIGFLMFFIFSLRISHR